MMNELNTFTCQVAIGKVYPNGRNLGFSTTKGITCLDAGSPKDMFDRLIGYYNSEYKARKLVEAGDMLKMSHSVKTSLYQLNDHGQRIQAEYTCVENSVQYQQLLGRIPCVFVYCLLSNRWFFFSFKMNKITGEGVVIPHVVSDLTSIKSVNNNTHVPLVSSSTRAQIELAMC